MHDYGIKLYEGIQIARKIQKHTIQYLMSHSPNDHLTSDVLLLKEDFQRKEYYNQPVPLATDSSLSVLVVFNPLAEIRREVQSVFVENSQRVCVKDPDGNVLEHQVMTRTSCKVPRVGLFEHIGSSYVCG